MMGHPTNIDRVTNEGAAFTDYYSQQSYSAGRAGTARVAAGCRLNDASALLRSESPELRPSAPLTHQALLPGGLARSQANRALAYIEANLGSKISRRELADLLTCSESHFARAFKRTLGRSPIAYVASRRVERAKFMMMSTRESLIEIALACGFADQSHLTRSFHRCVGMSPGSWRRSAAQMGNSKR